MSIFVLARLDGIVEIKDLLDRSWSPSVEANALETIDRIEGNIQICLSRSVFPFVAMAVVEGQLCPE